MSSEGKSTPEVRRAIKINGSHQQPTTVSPPILRAPCTGVEGVQYRGMMEGVSDHNLPWVMNCEMQQKPPLPQEGFWSPQSNWREKGVKTPLSNKIIERKRRKSLCHKIQTVKAHMLGLYYARVFKSSECSEHLTMRQCDISGWLVVNSRG